MDNRDNRQELIDSAVRVRERAHAPYSEFRVGAAVRAKDGRVFTGCNVENATYGLTVCAERVAIFKAVSDGVRPGEFEAVAVAAPRNENGDLITPCGACRQIIWEFCGDVEVLLADPQGKWEVVRAAALFPRPFDDSFL